MDIHRGRKKQTRKKDVRTRDEEQEEKEDSSCNNNTTHRPEWGSWGKVLEMVVGKKRKQGKLHEWVCVFVIAITSVVQRRERERVLGGGEGEGSGVN